jgi:Skp family chaperone for outer membrane proteins
MKKTKKRAPAKKAGRPKTKKAPLPRKRKKAPKEYHEDSCSCEDDADQAMNELETLRDDLDMAHSDVETLIESMDAARDHETRVQAFREIKQQLKTTHYGHLNDEVRDAVADIIEWKNWKR